MKRARTVKSTDIKQELTDRIVNAIEEGRMSPAKLWARSANGGLPVNYATKNAYTGANILLLWLEGADRGFKRNEWMTYNQAQDIGAQVRRGAKGCRLVRFNKVERVDPETGEVEFFPAPVPFSVFNVEEIDGVAPAARFDEFEPVDAAEQILTRSGARIIETGERAFYRESTDECFLPERTRFACAANFYHVATHELMHWTGHRSRLARDFSGRFGDEAYAFEELVAELGSAFCLARIGMHEGRLEYHASYLDSWLRVLRRDKNALFTAAGRAGDAYSHVMKLAGMSEAPTVPMLAAA
jgi:antirestriction protein ArdC